MTETASGAASPPLTLLLFGPMQALTHGRPLPHLRSRKALWLLALLALRHGRSVDREWLAGTLWPDTDQSRASTNLRVNLSELRHALGDQGERLLTPSRHTLALNLEGAAVDLTAFDAAMLSKKPESLKQAVTLYRGPLLEDCAEEWVTQERNIRAQQCLQVLQTLADSALAVGDHASAGGYYRLAVSLDPWTEAARRGLMETLAKSGDRNAALQVYREYVEFLRSDPNAAPDKETSALYAHLRAESHQQPRVQAVATAKGTAVSEAEPFVVSGYLPHPLTDLVGREEERIEVAAKLRGSRLVTLTGSGGIGKTRLAIAVAAEIGQDGMASTDGVCFVSLETISEGRLVAAQVASVLGLREEPGRSLLDSLIEHLRNKRLLLVLDNCEHLLEASVQFVGRLLQECARVRVLATSREALGIMGETTWRVPSLAAPDIKHLPKRSATLLRVLAGYESVQLFIERAQASQRDFALTENNALAVAQVCSQMEGIPLALEFAAARVNAMTVEQIAARLHDHLSLLTVGNRAAQSRQQTLRATLDWSHGLLSESGRSLLRRLSVFTGGWTLEAAESVCADPEAKPNEIQKRDVLNLLTALVDKSLVVFEEREGEVGGRYQLLETVRQYALEGLQASGEIERFRSRHRGWFMVLAEAEAEKLLEADPQISLRRLEIEYDNLRAALIWYALDEQGAEPNLRLAGALGRFLYLRGHYSEGRQCLEQTLEREEAQAATLSRARALNGAGVLASSQGDYAAAQTLLEESLRIYREWADRPKIAVVSNNLGVAYYYLGDYAAARALYEENLRLHRELENKRSVALTLNNLGTLAREQGEFAAAQAFLTESLSLRRELGDRLGFAVVSNNLGNVALCQGDHSLAHALHTESLHINRELGDRQGIANSLRNLGSVAHRRRDIAAAQAFYEESLTLYRELGDRRGMANVLNYQGEMAQEQGKYMEARTLHAESLTHSKEMMDKRGMAASLDGLASVILSQAEARKAIYLWGAASTLRKSPGTALPHEARTKYDQEIEQARSMLGNETFTTTWEEGRALTEEQAATYALEDAIQA